METHLYEVTDAKTDMQLLAGRKNHYEAYQFPFKFDTDGVETDGAISRCCHTTTSKGIEIFSIYGRYLIQVFLHVELSIRWWQENYAQFAFLLTKQDETITAICHITVKMVPVKAQL